MKRRRVFGVLPVVCAIYAAFYAVLFSFAPPVYAQGAESVLRGRAPRPSPAVEAAQKEVAAYQAAFVKMEKEKGWAAASRFFLTPDYKEIDLNGISRDKNEYIKRWADTYAHISKERVVWHSVSETAKTQSLQNGVYETVESLPHENTVIVTTRVVVSEVRPTAVVPLYGIGGSLNALPPQTQRLNTVRKVFQRTPNGLRLAQETVTSRPFGIYDRIAATE